VPGQEHGPAHDGEQKVAGLGDELEGDPQPEQGVDVQVALVVSDVYGGRVFWGEVLCADDVDPERAAMCAVSKSGS
jgi:hypothetical protein